MKKLIPGMLSIFLIVGFGCSSDDTIVDPPPPPPAPRVVVTSAASAPSLTSVDDVLWNSVTETALDISSGTSPKMFARSGSSLSDSVYVKAMRFNDSLYLRVRWSDASNDILKDPYRVDSVGPPAQWSHDELSFKEDHLLFMFDDIATVDNWDTWHWRSATTGYSFLAEGQIFNDASNILTADTNNSNILAALENIGFFGSDQPSLVHKDTSMFNDSILYTTDEIGISGVSNSDGWTIGQKVPGWRIDTSTYKDPESLRLSRWDIRAAFRYSSGQYTVMMCRPMNTGYSDDIDLTSIDSLQFKIGLLDFQDNILIGGTRRGFTGTFWIIM